MPGVSLALIVVWPIFGSAVWLLLLGAVALMIWSAKDSPRGWSARTTVAFGFALLTAATTTWALVRLLFFSTKPSSSDDLVTVMAAAVALVVGLLIARVLVTSRASPKPRTADEPAVPKRPPGLFIAGALSLVVGLALLAMIADTMQPPCSGMSATGPSPSVAWERGADGRSMPLAIVGLDGERYPMTREIRIEVDTWDRGADSAVPLDAEGLAVLIEGAWVPGSFTIQSRPEHGEALALVLVVAGDERLVPLLPAIGEGLDFLARTLAPADTLRVWSYSDTAEGLRPSRPGPLPRAAEPIGAVARALEQVMRLDAEFPASRHLLLICNAHPGVTARDKKALAAAVELAATLGVRVDVVAIDGAFPAAAPLEELALRTTGAVRRVMTTQGGSSVRAAIASYGRELASRSIVTFSPTDYCGEDKPARFELAAQSSDGRFARDIEEGVKITGFPLD